MSVGPLLPNRGIGGGGVIQASELGERLVALFLVRWEDDEALAMLLRSATTNADAAERMKDIVAARLLPAVGKFNADDAPRRAGLIATKVLGIALCRFVLRLPPVMSMSSEALVEWLRPTLQRYALGLAFCYAPSPTSRLGTDPRGEEVDAP